MFPFSSSDNNVNLEPLFKRPSFQLYDQIQNPISKHDGSSPFFSNFPSPFFDEHELPLNQIFHTDEQKMPDPTRKDSKLKQKTDDPPLRRRNLGAAPRKRTGKKDRHSKICTAQGIRDRRMRLSLQVARKFFDLQDMLGYDKASKTIEWLFNKSKKAIKELAKEMSDAKSESFVTSECEVVSGIEESSNIEIKEGLVLSEQKGDRKIACKPNTRESREKARARARCRTEEKMMGKRIQDPMQLCKSSPTSPNLEKLGQCPFDRDDQPYGAGAGAGAGEGDYSPLVQQPSDVGTIEKLLGSSSSNCPISCSSIDPSFMGLFGNWDGLLSNDRLNYAVTNIQASMAGNPNSIYSSSATTSDFPLFHQ